ncbi:MAG: D-alanyl-D-alanine carboxypeptidase family protein [Pseudomonadota bacterium]
MMAQPALAAAARDNNKYASLVMEYETGKIIHARNADKVLHPASLTKIMTLTLAFEAMRAGKLRAGDRIVFSKHAAAQSPTKMGIRAGGSMRADDAIKAIVTKSANDAAVALGEHLAGSESGFAQVMTRKARAIGMSKTTFKNASGLPNPNQVTTARDMATLARYVLATYPDYYRYFSMVNFSYNGATHRNHNRLLSQYEGMDGIKTGFVNASGYNLVSSAKRDGTRLVGVVFGGRTWQSRNAHMVELLDKSFNDIRSYGIAQLPAAGVIGTVNDTQIVSVKTVSMTHPPGSKPVMPSSNDPRYHNGAPDMAVLPVAAAQAAPGQIVQATTTTTVSHVPVPMPTQKPLHTQTVYQETAPAQVMAAAYHPTPAGGNGNWAIQIGAFQSRAATDLALASARKRLPSHIASAAQPEIVPTRTAQNGVSGGEWIFRARLRGFAAKDAAEACGYFPDCLTIAPGAY